MFSTTPLSTSRTKVSPGVDKNHKPNPGELWVAKRNLRLKCGLRLSQGDIFTIIRVTPEEESAVVWQREVSVLYEGKLNPSNTRELRDLQRGLEIEPLDT